MMDDQPIISSHETGSGAAQAKQRPAKPGQAKRVGAAIASAALPGLGQWLLGARARALIFVAAGFATGLLYWPLRLPRTYAGFLVLFVGGLALCITAAWNTLRMSIPNTHPGSRWWLVLLLPMALMSASVHSNRLLRISGFGVYKTPSTSMEETLVKGDHIIVDYWAYRHQKPSRGDLVVSKKNDSHVLKRLVAVAGDTIEGRNGVVILNGTVLREPYVRHTGHPVSPQLNNFGPILIPSGKMFVMGDNRDVSFDSRMREFGLVDEQELISRPLYVFHSDSARRGRTGTVLR